MSQETAPSQKKPKLSESNTPDSSGILNERILLLTFQSLKWDIHALCRTASVNRRLRALARRLLWKELCVYRAPQMTSSITESTGRVIGGWDALAKLLFYCSGCVSTRHFELPSSVPGHFTKSTRFSKTSGKSFLHKKCREDVLYVSDPCEHVMEEREEDGDIVGVYRGVFRGFLKSRTRACLIGRQVEFEDKVRCPYCGSRVWSMTTAMLIPRRNASKRLGSNDDGLEYFVCLNGHLHGYCWLVPLSDDDNDDDKDQDDGDDGGGGGEGSGVSRDHGNYGNGHAKMDGREVNDGFSGPGDS